MIICQFHFFCHFLCTYKAIYLYFILLRNVSNLNTHSPTLKHFLLNKFCIKCQATELSCTCQLEWLSQFGIFENNMKYSKNTGLNRLGQLKIWFYVCFRSCLEKCYRSRNLDIVYFFSPRKWFKMSVIMPWFDRPISNPIIGKSGHHNEHFAIK